MKLRAKDKVKVITGKYKGVVSEIEKVLPKAKKVVVKNVGIKIKHVKSREGVQGGRLKVIRPIHISNVMLVCPHCGKPTRVGFKVGKTKKSRICRKCKKEI